MARLRIGTVGYLNAKPLTDALDGETFELVADHPRGIAAALASGEVDVGLVPVAAALTDGDFRIVPGWCIGADGPVHSVAIFAETPPEQWTTLVLDGSSRTSAVLAQLIVRQGPLAAQVSDDLEIVQGAPGDGPKHVGGTTAALVIGDPAREMPDTLQQWDLAGLWKDWTGHPFVFAVWAGRADLPPEARDGLRAAGAQGLAQRADRYTGDDLVYLTEHIRYPLDDAALIGLRRFAKLAHDAGLVGTEHVQLFGPTVTVRARPEHMDAWLEAAASGDDLTDDQLAALAGATDAELAVAATMRRDTAFPGARGHYLVVHHVDAERVAHGGPGLEAVLDGAVASEATAVVLHGLDRVPDAVRRERLAAASVRGLQALGLDVGALPRVALEAGATLRWAASALADAGLSAVSWRVGAVAPDAAVWDAVAQAGLPVTAVLDAGAAPDAVERALVLLRRVASTGHLQAVQVDLDLPEGALVEPGRGTSARWLRTVARVRLAMPPSVHVVASPATQGVDGAQAALAFGADDLGVVGVGTPPPAPGGAVFEASVDDAERALRIAGVEPVRRGADFADVGGALTRWRRVRPVEARAQATG